MSAGQNRRKARQRALQALYGWELNPLSAYDIEQAFTESQDMRQVDTAYFSELLRRVIARTDELDRRIEPFLKIPPSQLDPIERCILRLAMHELINRPDVPYRVVINEAVDLAKKYGAEQGHRFINGVLDKAVMELRPHERR